MKRLIILATIILFYSCNNESFDSEYIPLELDSSIQHFKKIKVFEEYALAKDTIKIMMDRNLFFSYAYGFKIFNDSLYLIMDITQDKKVYIINNDGVIVKQIGKQGNNYGEYNEPTCVEIDKSRHEIIVYDDMLNKFIIYDYSGNTLEEYISDKKYTNMVFSDNNIYARRTILTMDFPKNVDNIVDVLNEKFEIIDSIQLPSLGNSESAKYMPVLMNGFIVIKNKLYLSTPNNFRILCYDLIKKELVAATNYIPKFINVVSINDEDETTLKMEKLKLNSSIYGMYNINDKHIGFYVDDKLILYDLNLNYLTDFKIQNHSLNIVKNNLYFITKPEMINDSIIGKNFNIRYI